MIRVASIALLCFARFAFADRELLSVTTSSQNTNVSILWDPVRGKGSPDIPLNDSNVAYVAESINKVCSTK